MSVAPQCCPHCSVLFPADGTTLSTHCPACGNPLTGGALEETWPPQRSVPTTPAEISTVVQPVSPELVSTRSYEAGEMPVVRLAPQAPEPVPGFTILGELGRGGMGVVYKAVQAGLNRTVALKMIRSGSDADDRELTRFRIEAEAVARLQHSHIVQIHEIGAHRGLPYFSLEYVDGGSLAQQLRGEPQPARKSAELVELLARAMHAAHQRGIVHRDLKPANVLLTKDGAPKITDFGLAKQLDTDQGQTRTGAVMGTPSYMAPEQASGKIEAIGAATDVYALGAILYEMLTGRPPFRGTTVLETLDQVRSLEPVPPRRLQPGLPRDLETICLKCLHKEPAKRYASAEALAEDVCHFLNGEPIVARPVPGWERAWKWARRRPAAAGLVAVVVVALVSVLLGGAWYNEQLRREKKRAEDGEADALAKEAIANEQRRRAEAYRKKSLEAVDRMLTRVGGNRLSEVPGMTEVQKELLLDALAFYQSFPKDGDNPDPGIRKETAWAYQRAAGIRVRLGQRADAERDFQEALKLHEALAAEDPERADYQNDLALCCMGIGWDFHGTANIPQARRMLTRAEAILKTLAGKDPDNAVYEGELANCWNSLGVVLQAAGDTAAEEFHRRSLAAYQKLAAREPNNDSYQDGMAFNHHNLCAIATGTSRPAEAVKHQRQAVAILERLAARHSGDSHARDTLASGYSNLASILGAGDESVSCFQKALYLREQLARDFPRFPAYQDNVAETCQNLGNAFRFQDPEEAEAAYLKAVALRTQIVQEHPKLTAYQHRLANTLVPMGIFYDLHHRPEAAEQAYKKAQAIQEPLVAADGNNAEAVTNLAKIYFHLGCIASRKKRYREAVDLATKAISRVEPVHAKNPGETFVRTVLMGCYALRADAYIQEGKNLEAIPDFIRVKALEAKGKKPTSR